MVRRILRPVASASVVGAILALGHNVTQINIATASLLLMLAVLIIAARWGFAEALAAALAGGVGLEYFFLSPYGVLPNEPQYWLPQMTFLATAILGSRISERARRTAKEAERRRVEMEKLFAFGQSVLLAENVRSMARRAVDGIVETFGAEGVALYDRRSGELFRSGTRNGLISDEELRRAVDVEWAPAGDSQSDLWLLPVLSGTQPIGGLGVVGAELSAPGRRTIAARVAVALEKARAIEEAGRAEAVRQSEELKSAVIDALAHEFKTPLTSIKAAVTCLIARNTQGASPEVCELLAVIDEETDRMQQLLGQAFELARLEATDLNLDKQPQDMTDTIYGTLEEFHSAFESRPLQVQIPAVFPLVPCDASLIRQVLKQLLENALKYSPPGSPVAISCEQQDHSVVVRVTDSGVGVPDEEQSEIFNQYYRGRLGAGRAPGTGMGLAIAKRIVELHGGRIWVTSRTGAGSVFHFSLPVWINQGAVAGRKGAAA